MKWIVVIFSMLSISLSAFADGPEPIDFLKKALQLTNSDVSDAKIISSMDPIKPIQNNLGYYIDRVAQKTGPYKDRIAFRMYRLIYVSKGAIHDCNAMVGDHPSFGSRKKFVSIEICDKSLVQFLNSSESDTVFSGLVSLDQ